MKVADLERAFDASQLLGSEDVEEDNRNQTLLVALLQVKFAAPVAVGSGRQGTRHKVHAFVHSSRLVTPSWSQACKYTNSQFTNVGDLGEAGIMRGLFICESVPPPFGTFALP